MPDLFHRRLRTTLNLHECEEAIGTVIQGPPLALGLPPPLARWSVIVGRVDGTGFWLRTRTFLGSALMMVGRWRAGERATEVSVWLLPEVMWLLSILLVAAASVFLARGFVQIVIAAVALLMLVLFAFSWRLESNRLWAQISSALTSREPRSQQP